MRKISVREGGGAVLVDYIPPHTSTSKSRQSRTASICSSNSLVRLGQPLSDPPDRGSLGQPLCTYSFQPGRLDSLGQPLSAVPTAFYGSHTVYVYSSQLIYSTLGQPL
jgi:hypothetical protein